MRPLHGRQHLPAAPALAQPPLPQVNELVLLRVAGTAQQVRSRVEDEREGLVVVAAVPVPGEPEPVAPGRSVTVSWAVRRGLVSVACELVEHVLDQPPLWLLRPVGEASLRQRREFARADVMGRAEVATTGVDGPVTGGAGELADVSEGGARVLLDAGQWTTFADGDDVQVLLNLPGGQVWSLAHVVGAERLAGGRQLVRVHFDLCDADADLVRREVMRRQVEARRLEREA